MNEDLCNIRIFNDKFNTETGKYSCVICFVDSSICTHAQKLFIKQHIRRLNYLKANYVFDQLRGSNARTFQNKTNKNEIILEVNFVKVETKINLAKGFDDFNQDCFPTCCNDEFEPSMCARNIPSPPPYVREN